MKLRLLLAGALAALGLSRPAFASPASDLDLSAYRGKVVYLDFWASWCVPCRTSFSWMADIQSSFGSRGLVVIAVNVDHDRAAADRFLENHLANFKVVYDPHGSIANQYKVSGMPMSFVIGRDGKTHFSHAGFFETREDSYASQITQLLAQPAP
jgi:thiol-disulfide isomerase/thioredoxin